MYITGEKARSYVNRYHDFRFCTIYNVYKKPSERKILAWRYCWQKCYEMKGHGITVLSYNNQVFTVGWCYAHPDTGVLMLHVETYANSYDMEM